MMANWAILVILIGISANIYLLLSHRENWETLLGYASLSMKLSAVMVIVSITMKAEWAIDAAMIYIMLSLGGIAILAYFNSRRGRW